MSTAYLAYGWDNYEYPCAPIKVFWRKEDAEKFIAALDAYQLTRPQWPHDDASEEEFEAFDAEFEAWKKGHPAAEFEHRDGFSVMPIEIEETQP